MRSAYNLLLNELEGVYDRREAGAIAHELLEDITGLTRIDRAISSGQILSQDQENELLQKKGQLLEGMPLQYVTGKAWFMRRQLQVGKGVLIPRPETEELVDWLLQDLKSDKSASPKRILDIGTGSGCIAVSVAVALPHAIVTGIDLSNDALAIARRNAAGTNVILQQCDILNKAATDRLPIYDRIISNPPYIPEAKRASIHNNIKDYEPSMALFVPDEDALLFYRAIAAFGVTHLSGSGLVYCEVEQDLANEVKAVFEGFGYHDVRIRKDLSGHDRMLRARFDQAPEHHSSGMTS